MGSRRIDPTALLHQIIDRPRGVKKDPSIAADLTREPAKGHCEQIELRVVA